MDGQLLELNINNFKKYLKLTKSLKRVLEQITCPIVYKRAPSFIILVIKSENEFCSLRGIPVFF